MTHAIDPWLTDRLLEIDLDEVRRITEGVLTGYLPFWRRLIHVGDQVDWSGPHLNDQEWRVQIVCFNWLRHAAATYREQPDERIAARSRDLIEQWISTQMDGKPWAPTGNLAQLPPALRAGNSRFFGWLGALQVFRDSEAWDQPFIDRMIEAVRVQLNYMADHLVIVGNKRIGQADSLIIAGLRLPQLDEAPRWRAKGVAVINEAAVRQFHDDGSHREVNPSYHLWMNEVMAFYCELGRRMPELGLEIDPKRVATMFDYAVGSIAPDGAFNGLHDCQPYANHYPGMSQQAGTKRDRFLEAMKLPNDPPPTSQCFADAGQSCVRSDWSSAADYVTFDASLWGGSHAHLSRNAIQLHVRGEPILIDPGHLGYEITNPLMPLGKGTRAHNTVTVNGWNQSPADPTRFEHWAAPGCDLMIGEHEGGYWPGKLWWYFDEGLGAGTWAKHHRSVYWDHSGFLVVIDAVNFSFRRKLEAETIKPVVDVNWQCMPEAQVALAADASSATVTRRGAGAALHFIDRPADTTADVAAGDMDPPRGWVPIESEPVPAPQLRLTSPVLTTPIAEFITVIFPFANGAAPEVEVAFDRPDPAMTARLQLKWPVGRTDELWWTYCLDHPLYALDSCRTDAAFAHLRRDPDADAAAITLYPDRGLRRGDDAARIIGMTPLH